MLRWFVDVNPQENTQHDQARMKQDADYFEWDMTQPLVDAMSKHENKTHHKSISRGLRWNRHVPGVEKTDHITVLFHENRPLFTTLIKGGTTLKAVMRSLERGLHTPITNNDMSKAHIKISGFPKHIRTTMVTHADAGTLCPVHLLEMMDHRFYEGHLRRNKGAVWTYWIGS